MIGSKKRTQVRSRAANSISAQTKKAASPQSHCKLSRLGVASRIPNPKCMPTLSPTASGLRDYYGALARIGVIYMASSTVMEPELYAMAPTGVSIHTTRIRLPDVTASGIAQMMGSDDVDRCASLLADAPLQVITFGGTGATFLNGIGWDRTIIRRMEESTHGIPCSTTASAVIRALRALSLKRISVVTPYVDEITGRARTFLEGSGFEVLSAKGLGLSTDQAIAEVPLDRVYEFATTNCHSDADGLFISCTNLRTVGALEALEQQLGRPVISSTQATFWDCLRVAHATVLVPNFGRLFFAEVPGGIDANLFHGGRPDSTIGPLLLTIC